MTIQLPPLKSPSGTGPHAGCSTGQRPFERWWPAAYGPRVEGPDPVNTSTNGGYHRAAPPGNLGIETGQRPTIHRLQQCRGPRGPRASVTAGTRGTRDKTLGNPMLQWATAPMPGTVDTARGGTNTLPATERQPTWQGRRKNPYRARGHQTPSMFKPTWPLVIQNTRAGRRNCERTHAGLPPERGLPTFAFTYTLRPSLDTPLARKRSTVPTRLPGGLLCMGWSVRWSIFPYKVGHPGSPPTRAGRDLGLVRAGASLPGKA